MAESRTVSLVSAHGSRGGAESMGTLSKNEAVLVFRGPATTWATRARMSVRFMVDAASSVDAGRKCFLEECVLGVLSSSCLRKETLGKRQSFIDGRHMYTYCKETCCQSFYIMGVWVEKNHMSEDRVRVSCWRVVSFFRDDLYLTEPRVF